MNENTCVFAGIKDEKRSGDDPLYECDHGKTVTWTTARKLLGLPSKPFDDEAKKK